jgi:ABC-type multidrug transport system fused ATPase/permease subunit
MGIQRADGQDDIDEARVVEAARQVGADLHRTAAARLRRTGDERGASLSVGERQLLSFARALAYDPHVLILDEATSSVDSALEQRIDDALARTDARSYVRCHCSPPVHGAERRPHCRAASRQSA